MTARVDISDEMLHRIHAFKQVVETVVEEELDFPAYMELLLHQAINSMVADLLEPVDREILVRSLQQLGAEHPEQVYGFIAKTLKTGAADMARRTVKKRLGFHPLGE